MKALLSVTMLALLAGCTLPVPSSKISFNPTTHTINIASPKDIMMSNIVAQVTGTNVTIRIGYYQSQNSIEVVKAAVIAQQNQMNAVNEGTKTVLSAVVGAVK